MAALVLGLAGAEDDAASRQRERFLSAAREAQAASGGWGPFAGRPAEPFDTALVLLALAKLRDAAGATEMIARGQAYLLRAQETVGNWPETTRPAGGESYSHRVSTTAWVVQALVATGP
jgi:hypothetical protein